MKAALSFTGGKNCLLAMHRAAKNDVQVVALVTFCPADTSMPFRSHSLQIMEQQAKAMGLVHHVYRVKEEQGGYVESYRKAIRHMRETWAVEALITGDVQQVCSDFMERAVQDTGVELMRPLWQQPHVELHVEMAATLQAVVTCIDTRRLGMAPAEADSIVGRPLTRDWLMRERDGEKLGGEFGEYHTMVIDAPLFVHGRVDVSQGACVHDASIVYWHTTAPALLPKLIK